MNPAYYDAPMALYGTLFHTNILHLVRVSNFGNVDFSSAVTDWALTCVPFEICVPRLLYPLLHKSVATAKVERSATKDCRSQIRGKAICWSEIVVLCALGIDGDK